MPKLKLLTMFRLALFQMGLGILAVLTLGVLNQVMIAELTIPATVTGLILAMSQFVAPARIWFGQMSDAKPMFGLHRTGYVWIGAGLFTLILSASLQTVWKLGSLVKVNNGWTWTNETYIWIAVAILVFSLYGLATSAASTTFMALLVDVSDEDNRGQLIGIVWTMMTVGIVIGGVSSKILLKPLENPNASLATLNASINYLFIVVPLVVFGLALIATWGVEKKYSRYASRSMLVNREDKINLLSAIKILTSSRQTGLFFGFMLVMTTSLFLQEAVLEPYGRQVFSLSVGESSQLNAFWGIGMLLSLSATGFFLVPRLGKRKTTALGCLMSAVSFILIILAGFTQTVGLFKFTLLLFGLSAGIGTTGALSLMLDLTAAETAGTFVGAWGLAQAIARGSAVIIGGAILDIGKQIFTNLVLSYALVFGTQAVGMLAAIWCLRLVNVREFQDNAKKAIATIMEGDLD